MERQSSFGSTSSAGSAFTSRSATTKLVSEAEKEQGIDNQGQNLLTALFGALYTLAKEKINDSAKVAMLAIWVDFLMIFTLILMPEYPWKVDPDQWIYKVFYYIQIHLPIANAGYTFYLVIFYILVATLFISVIICVWVGWCFMNDSFPFLWPIKVARVVVSLFVSMFYIASLNVFLMACACKNVDGHWEHLVFHLDCLAFPHVIHAAFSITSGVVFFIVAALLVLGDHELEPMTRSLLAAPHSMCELRALMCKTVITVADILFKPMPHVQVVLYTISCGLLFYYHARMVPHYVPWINVLRGGLNLVLAWVALMACILSYTVPWEFDHGHPVWHDDEYRQILTTVMAVGVPVMFLVGGGICWLRLVYAWRTALKFKHVPPGVKPRTIHRFATEFDVEVASRIGRVWDEEGVLDLTAMDLAENVLKAGVAMKPNSVFLHIAYSNFLIDVRHNIQSGWNHLEQAKKLEPNLSYQFSIFTRAQEHKQKSAGGGGGAEGSVDLVSYVEFQKNYKSLLVYHKASLVATRDFWRLLTRDIIPLERLGHSFKRMDEMEFMAEKTYKLVLDRYPTNAKLLKSYGKFLENVKNDPWGAARYYAEAEKQEELAESAAAEIQLGDGEGGLSTVDEKSAIITINALGIIQTVNKVACQIMGYRKGELEGKNVSCLMPPPFSIRHNTYVRNYLNTGKAKILDRVHEVVALHKDRYVFPMCINVSKISGNGPDAVFMGLMKPPVEPDPDTIKAWLLTTGTMLCVDQSFLDYAGWAPNELVGRAFSSLGVDSSELDDLIAECAGFNEDQLKAGAVQITTSIKHKYAEPVPVHIKLEMGGTESQRILLVVMKRLAQAAAMASFDSKGRCVYANTPLASMLGYKLHVLRSKDISQLLPQPYGPLHLKWFQEADNMVAKQTPGSCRNSITSIMLSSNGTPIHVITTIIPHNPAGTAQGLASFNGGSSSMESTWAVKVERSSHVQLLNERRLMLLASADGRILWVNSGSPATLFGLEPTALVGMQLASVVDVFAEYSSGLDAGEVAAALAALLSRTSSKPGSSWRVGVGAAANKDAEATPLSSGSGQKRIMRQLSNKSRLKPAVMVVSLPTDDIVPEDVLTAAGQDAAVVIQLWRADMLLGVAEVVEGCSLVRVEPSVGMLFGTSHTNMFHTSLTQWLNLPAGTQMEDLMGTKGLKKGGLKSSRMQKVGPRMQSQGMHADRRPVSVVVQATMKDGTHEDRLVLAIKVAKPLTGAPNLLASLIAAEAEGLGMAGWSGGVVDGMGGVAELVNLSAAGGVGLIPALAMDKVGPGTDVDLMGTNTHRATVRSNAADSTMATARLVNVDLNETTESGPGRVKHRAPAVLVGSPTGGEEGQGYHPKKRGTAGHVGFGENVEGGGEDEGDSNDVSDPGRGTRTPAGRDMAVSSDSEDGGVRQSGRARGKKTHLTEEEMEAVQEAKGAKKAREWLDSGFGGFKKEDDDAGLALPGAVADPDEPLQLVHGRGGHPDEAAGDEGTGSDPGGDRVKAGGEEASEASASIAGDGGMVSDYTRGKRLRKLTRLLSSKAALQVVIGFRFKVVLLAAAILLLHLGSFAAITGFINKQASYLTELSAAGEVLDTLHRTATLSLVLEAAQRGYGFTAADTEKYAAEMETAFSRYEQLHQGLYLGFNGLRSLDTPELYDLWHMEHTIATVYLNSTDPSQGTTSEISLFNLGALYTAAARDVHYAALYPDSMQAQGVQLSDNRQWIFLQANGPGVLYSSYLKSLDYMVLRAQDNIHMLQTAVLALLLIEGFFIMFMSVGLVVRLLSSISVHRQALFSVFLAIPHGFLRTLASKSVNIGDEEADDDEEVDKAMQAAEEAKKQKKKVHQQEMLDDDDHSVGGGHSRRGSTDGFFAPQPVVSKNKRRASFVLNQGTNEGDAAVFVNATHQGGTSGGGKDRASTFGSKAGAASAATDKAKLFNGKQLATSAKSAYQLAWPFVLWGILVVVLYGVSYNQFGEINENIVAIKMSQRSLAQASRVTYFTTRVALEADPVKRADMQGILLEEAGRLDAVYWTALYGGATLEDSKADGAHDEGHGSLFSATGHKHLLFELHGCLRFDQATCLPEGSPFYAVSHHGIDPMVQRLAKEAELMSMEPAADILPSGDRFQFVWSVTWVDLHDGLSQLASLYVEEAKAAFAAQRTTHIVLVFVMFVAGSAFLLMMLRPFLKHISKESRRCAELLAQLPPDMDVEGMVAATWSVVKQERILAERSGKSFINNIGGSISGNLLGRLSFMSTTRPFFSQPQQQFNAGAPEPLSKPRFGGAGVSDGGERLFSPRQSTEQFSGGGHPKGYGRGAGGAGGPRGSGTGSVGPGGTVRRSMEFNPTTMVAASSSLFQTSNSSPLGGGGDVLRHRNVHGSGFGGGKSPSKRAVVPTDY